jgi:hypothetical protein
VKKVDSNLLKQALAGCGAAGSHPDADVLNAFSEGALLGRERETVLAHVAACADCRMLLSLANEVAPQHEATTSAALVPLRGRSPLRIWIPALASAAAIALAITVVMRYQPAAPKQEQNAAVNADAGGQADAERSTTLPRATAEAAARKIAPAAPASRQQGPAPAAALSNTVTSAALASAPAGSIARPHWRINEQGQPERSFGNGPWEPVLPNQSARMRVVSIFLGEVWMGGENSTVMRTFDNGTTWRVVSLPEKDGRQHAIAHIRFESAEAITIEAADRTTWVSADGGASWK